MSVRRQSYKSMEALEILKYTIEKNATVRATAKAFGVSKSTVHKIIAERAEKFLSEGYEGFSLKLIGKAKAVLAKNKAERHIRGGLATRERYAKLKHHK